MGQEISQAKKKFSDEDIQRAKIKLIEYNEGIIKKINSMKDKYSTKISEKLSDIMNNNKDSLAESD
ncbi:MAG: hypothetical protein MHPSP_004127, partial [Paramarteilia canceri]